MSPAAISGLAALTVITGILAVSQLLSDLFLRDRSRLSDRVDAEFLKKKGETGQEDPAVQEPRPGGRRAVRRRRRRSSRSSS